MLKQIKKFFKLRDGVAAVEFAIIAPLMLTMYVGTVEAGNYLSVARKVTTASASLADLVARAAFIDDDEMDLMFEAVSVIMRPQDISDMKVVVTAVQAEDVAGTMKYRVKWSDTANGNAPARVEDTFIVLPNTNDDPIAVGEYLVVSELSFSYQPVITNAPGVSAILHGGIVLEEVFYDTPREDTFWRCADFNNEEKCDTNEHQ